jgi:hypothetical protein
MTDASKRTVRLRAEHDGDNSRYLDASLDMGGSLVIKGQDLGPDTAIVSSDGEYEWTSTFAPVDIPALVALLGGAEGADILDVLESYTDQRSYELERLIRDSDVPHSLFTWSG